MLDPRRFRTAGTMTLGAMLLAAVAVTSCSSEPKKPEPPAKTSPPMAAKGDTSSAKPASAPKAEPSKPVEVAKVEPAKPVAKVVPVPAPVPSAPKAEPASPAAKAPRAEEPAKPAPGSTDHPPKPPVNVREAPKSHELADGEAKDGPAPAAKVEPAAVKPTEPTPAVVKKPDAPVAPIPAAVPVAKDPAPVAPAPMIKSPSQIEDEKNKALLGALSEEKRIEIEKRKFLADEYVRNGEGAYQALKFQDAESWAAKALDQDNGHAGARDLYRRSRAALGMRTDDASDIAHDLSEMAKVKREMAEQKARTLYSQGRNAMGKGDHDLAIRSFEDTLTVIQQDPYGISWGDLKQNAEARLREAKAAREKATEIQRRSAAAAAYESVKREELARQVAEEAKWQALMDEAVAAYGREDFANAESLSRQALDIRPSSAKARDLMNAANRARHGQTTEATRQKEKEEFRRWKLDMDASTIPYSDVLTAPGAEHWDRISRLRRSLGQEGSGPIESPEAEALRNRLSGETTTFVFDGQTLTEAVGYLSARHGINIVVDEQVRADADAQPLPPFKLTGVPLKDALELLLSNVSGLTYRVKGNVVFITKPEFAREAATIRVHPVGDLTMKINNFVAPNLILKAAGAESDENSPLFGATTEGISQFGEAEDLITLIKDHVGDTPEVWNADGVAIDAQGNANLLVVAEPALQDAVATFLRDLRKFSGLVVNIESRFLSVSDNFLRDVGVDIRGLGGATGSAASLDDVTNGLVNGASAGYDNGGVGLPANASGKPSSGAFYNDFGDGDYRGRTEHIWDRSLGTTLSNLGGAVLQWTLLDDTQLAMIWRAVEKKTEARVLQSPNLTVYNTQRANITLINQLAFVQDFDVEVAQTAFIADPQIAIIQDGLDLDVKPIVSNDRRYVTLQLQPTIATLKRPIQTFTTSLGAFTSPVTLQLPEINIQKAQTTVRVPNGGTLLIGGLKNISQVDLKSETPYLSKIPLVSFFFSRRGSSQEYNNLLIIIRARITDLADESSKWGSR